MILVYNFGVKVATICFTLKNAGLFIWLMFVLNILVGKTGALWPQGVRKILCFKDITF